jgi:acylpyruvate hydrolase
MKAVRYVSPEGEARVGALLDGAVRDAGPAGPQGFVPTPEAWRSLADAGGPDYSLADVRLLHPVVPDKILAIGVNYRSHADESELDVPAVPVVFAKWPSSLVGPEEDIVVPAEESRPDFEGEVAFVLGETVYRADEEAARRALGGVTAINDVSGRRAQLETPLRQFTLGKSFDTFSPLGPCIASPDGLDIGDIRLITTVSGEVMQDASTSDLVFGFVDLVVYLSKGLTLRAGDVIATGTPGGVGDSRTPPRYLREGDVVEIEVEGVGTLRNPVRLERAQSSGG